MVIKMEIKTYKKDAFYSYTLGAFPTIEMLKNHSQDVIKVYVHSSFKNEDALQLINTYRGHGEIEFNDKMINKLSQKENCYVIGVFRKYLSRLEEDHHVVLVNQANMGNLGTIIRSCLGFNIHNIAIIKPAADCFDPKVIRASMGAIFSCNISYFSSLEEYMKAFPNHKLHTFMLQASTTLQDFKFDKTCYSSLVFGNESSGLDIKYLNEDSIIIKHSDAIDSLNLPSAVAISLYEFRKQVD